MKVLFVALILLSDSSWAHLRSQVQSTPLQGAAVTEQCPLNAKSQQFNSLQPQVIGALEQLKAEEEKCSAQLERAAGGTAGAAGGGRSRGYDGGAAAESAPTPGVSAALTAAIQNLRGGRETTENDCITTETRVRRRNHHLNNFLARSSKTSVESSNSSLAGHGYAEVEGWVAFTSRALPQELYDAYTSCIVPNGQGHFFINQTCVIDVNEMEIADVEDAATNMNMAFSGSRCRNRVVSDPVATAIRTGMEAVNTMLSNTNHCPVQPMVIAAGMNLLNSALSSFVGMELISFAANLGASFINALNNRQFENAESAIAELNAIDTRRNFQCLYATLTSNFLGCNRLPEYTEILEANAQAFQAKSREHRTATENYSRQHKVHPDVDYRLCVERTRLRNNPAGNNEGVTTLIDGWKVKDLEDAAFALTVDRRKLTSAWNATCGVFNKDKDKVSHITELGPPLQRLSALCENNQDGTIPSNEAIIAGVTDLSAVIGDALTRVPVTSDMQYTIQDCFSALPNGRGQSLAQIRTLGAEIADLSGAVEARDSVFTESGMEGVERARDYELWAAYHRTFTNPKNPPAFNLHSVLYLAADTSPALNLTGACHQSDLDVANAAAQLQAVCLLNSAIYIRDKDPRVQSSADTNLNIRSADAEDWFRKCAPFLNDPRLAPQIEGGAFSSRSAAPNNALRWQCAAIKNFDTYSSNLLAIPRQEIRSIVCPQPGCSGRNRGRGCENNGNAKSE